MQILGSHGETTAQGRTLVLRLPCGRYSVPPPDEGWLEAGAVGLVPTHGGPELQFEQELVVLGRRTRVVACTDVDVVGRARDFYR